MITCVYCLVGDFRVEISLNVVKFVNLLKYFQYTIKHRI